MTGNTIRGELLDALAELGVLLPEWRLGQTLANLAMAAGHAEAGAVWDLEDSEALAAARRFIETLRRSEDQRARHGFATGRLPHNASGKRKHTMRRTDIPVRPGILHVETLSNSLAT